jgi:hypothetical protein
MHTNRPARVYALDNLSRERFHQRTMSSRFSGRFMKGLPLLRGRRYTADHVQHVQQRVGLREPLQTLYALSTSLESDHV